MEKTDNQKEKTLFDPEDNVLHISGKKQVKIYFLLSKIVLKKFGNLELHSLGRAADNVVRVTQFLKDNGFATEESIGSKIVDTPDRNSNSGVKAEISFVVKMKKSDKFDELTKDLK